jgi:uncharacterized LabA/DUF88 family protein
MRRVAIFVDGSNLYRSLKERGLLPVDMTRLAWRLAGGRPASMRFYTAPFRGHQGFVKSLESRGWIVVQGHLSREGGEKGVDVALAVDLLLSAAGGIYDEAVLVSGDGDLARAVEAARELGFPVRVVQFQDAIARELAAVAAEVELLDGLDWEELRERKEHVAVHSG